MRDVLAFAVVAVAIVVVPGPDMALVLRNGLFAGRRAAVLTALGVNAGLVVWAFAAALGLAALLHASSTAFTIVKLAGAAYLVWLGLRTLRDAWRGHADAVTRLRAGQNVAPFREGLLSNVLNPKIALVFTVVIPQFVDPTSSEVAQTFVFAGAFIAMGLFWLTGYALLVARIGTALRRPATRRALDALAGTILTVLGLRLAFERR